MDFGSLSLILALLIFIIWFVARPFFDGSNRSAMTASPQEQALSSLLAERDQVVNALQELDFDHLLGKVPEDDYPSQRSALLRRGADVLRQMDILAPQPAPVNAALTEEDRIEVAISAHRQVSQSPAASDDPLEAAIASRRRVRQGESAGFCPICGKPVQKADRFCPKCGGALS